MPVECRLCGEEFGSINYRHLWYVHEITVDEYRRRFPYAEIESQETRRKISDASELVRPSTSRMMFEVWEKRSLAEEISIGNKISASLMGNTNRLGKPKSEEECRAISESLSGRTLSEAHKRHVGEATNRRLADPEYRKRVSGGLQRAWNKPGRREEASKIMKRIWAEDKDYQIAQAEARGRCPNGSELVLDSFLQKFFPGEWKYVGGGEVVIGGRTPDFINVNGLKEVIELFGYHHNPEVTDETEEDKIAHYRKYGFGCLVIWHEEIWDWRELRIRLEAYKEVGLVDPLEY